MSSSFKSLNLFGSGPHRFSRSPQGELAISDVALGSFTPKTNVFGLVELEIVVRGRLVAVSDSALWTLRDAITAQLTDPPAKGTLVDHTGRSYADMSFLRYEESPRTDRGRAVSIAYLARFRKLIE